MFFELFSFTALEQNFFRAEIVEQFVYVVIISFCSQKFSGRDVEECNSANIFSEMNACQKIVLFMVKDVVIYGYSRSY